MPLEAYDIQPLFAVPYFRADLSHAIDAEQVAFVKQLKMIRNRTNEISEDLYIFEAPELAGLKAGVQDALDAYSQNVMGIDARLEVTQSWALMNPPGVGMHTHSHSNSIVSGSLYFDELPEPPARMIFDKHTAYQQLELNPVRERQNLFNTPVNIVTPQSREILLFPSELNHMVEANGASVPRWSIAFNCFVRGKVGSYRDVSELRL